MNDLISRQAAIDVIRASASKYTGFMEMEMYTDDDAVEAINGVPSAQRWIPVSERLPEESDGTVLVCMPNKFPYNEKEPFVNAKHNRQVETATYSQYSDTWHFKNGGVTSVRPIAWMPLPKPWRGEENDSDKD